tara:strand:- start:104 stop:262 length:159 start_codon:yes stop_codon:yes gene_type:complete
MKCEECGLELIWGGDHTFEDHGLDGDGIVTNSSCDNDDCSTGIVLTYIDLND